MHFFKKYFSFIIVVLFLVFFAFFLNQNNNFFEKTNNSEIKYAKIAGQTIKVTLATTLLEQERGLSGKEILKEDEGMLFVFQKPSKNYFWMKDMKFSIDIIWIDENFRVIYLEKGVSPESYPLAFGPKENSKYVLEVLAGFSEKNNLKEKDSVKFLR
jgi:uncharacterized membrane protein (UPF0127 family)